MNVLEKCCYRSMSQNRKRTAVTIMGIILATALITAVACMAESFRASVVVLEKKVNGDFHYLFTGVAQENLKYFENNRNVEKIGLAEETGYALLEGCTNPDKPYLYIRGVDAAGIQAMSLELTEGRMPYSEEEIVISRHIRSNGNVDLAVGDTLTVQVGERFSDGYSLNQHNPYISEEEFVPYCEKTYTIVGIVERPNYQVELRSAPGYSVFTCLGNVEGAERLEVYASYTKDALKHGTRVTAGLLGISTEEYESMEVHGPVSQVARDVVENHNVVRWELMRFSSTTMNMFYGMAAIAVLIIIVASVFCIRNSFMISLTEKMKLYGRLASVGTTSGQQRKIVYYEARFLAAVGIPLGVFSGILAAALVVQVTGKLMETELGVKLVFSVSVPAVIVSMLLALLNVYLSASGSARRAARLTPVCAIRASSTVKVGRKEMRCPKFLEKIFGIGGKLAYRNLQRGKVKYRTTVISIVVSVAVFIGVYSFVELVSQLTTVYYGQTSYQLLAYIYDKDSYDKAVAIAGMDGVERAEVLRRVILTIEQGQQEIPYVQEYKDFFGVAEGSRATVMMAALDERGYENYCRELGVDPEEAADKAIVNAYFEFDIAENGKRYHYEGNIAKYQSGDMIEFTDIGAGEVYEIPVLIQTDIMPMSLEANTHNMVQIIVSDRWWDEHGFNADLKDIGVYIRCQDADALEEAIKRDFDLREFTVYNFDATYRSRRSMYLAVAIFLYGFIAVVSLIGVTSIFNTVTTNLELRAPELAMCRAVGMTKGEFRRMVWLESIFYGGKGLLLGVPLGIAISLGFHYTMGAGLETKYSLPVGGIVISVGAVFLLLFCIMKYSMDRLHNKNIMETIQNENI